MRCWWTCSATIRPTTHRRGAWGIEGGGQSVHHNVLVAGANAVSVDAVGAAIMGFEPTRVAHLALAQRRGFGSADLGTIWVRGNEIEHAGPYALGAYFSRIRNK